jgi:hypothetical protein
MFENHQFAGIFGVGIKIKGQVFAVKSQTGQINALCPAGLRNPDGGRIRNNGRGLSDSLFGIPELYTLDLSTRFDGDENIFLIRNFKYTTYRLFLV